MAFDQRSPGSHPHSHRPNWQPAETVEEYLRNCQDGLETYSEHRMAKLMGGSRVWLWRAKMMAEIPEDLFNTLLDAADKARKPISQKQLAIIGQVFSGGTAKREIETCPCCGYVLRVRAPVPKHLANVVLEYLSKQKSYYGFSGDT